MTELDDRLRHDFHAVRERVERLPLPDITNREPRGSKRPRAVVVVGAALVVLLVVGVAVIAGHSQPAKRGPVARAPNALSFIDDGPLKAPRTYNGGHITLLPPPAGVEPRITASAAYATAGRAGAALVVPPVPTPHLVLTIATISDYRDAEGPIVDHRLVWVVIFTNVRVRTIGGPIPRSGTSYPATTSRPTTGSVLSFVDATTGTYTNTETGEPT